MKNSKMTKRRTGGRVMACAVLAAAIAFTAVFAQEGAEQEKETSHDGGAVKPGELIIRSPIPYPPPARRKPSYIVIPRVADTEVIVLHVLAETDLELHDGGFRSAKGEAEAEDAAREVMDILKRHGAGRVEKEKEAGKGTLRYRVDVKGVPEEKRFECLKELHVSRAAWKAEYASLSENLPRKREILRWGKVKYDEEAKYTDLIQVKFREGSKVRLNEGKLVTLSESKEERKEVEEVGAALEAYGVNDIRRMHEDAGWKASYAENLRKKSGNWVPDPNLWFDLDTGDLPLPKRYKLFHVLSESALIEAMDFEYIGVYGNSVATGALRLLGMQSTHRKKLRPELPYVEKWYYLELPHNAISTYIYLRFAPDSKVRLREGKLVSLGGPPEEQEKLREVNALLERFEISRIERDTLMSEEEVKRRKEEYEKSSGRESADLNLWFEVNVEHMSDEEKLDFVNGLNAFDIIEKANIRIHVIDHSSKLPLEPLIGGLLPTGHSFFDHNYCTLTAL